MKITKSELQQIIKEALDEEMGMTYGDDIDTPSLQTQMGDAIMAAVKALDAGDMKAARAATDQSARVLLRKRWKITKVITVTRLENHLI